MFYFRINRLKISDNREGKRFLGILGKDLAQVKLISFVTTENANLPDMTEYLETNDQSVKLNILRSAVQKVVSSRILTTIENIRDNHIMEFGDTGYVLYQSKRIPENFDWQFIAYESDKRIRHTASMVQDVINDKGFKNFSLQLASILGTATNPAFTAAVEIAKFTTSVITKSVKNNKDDMIGLLYTSLNRREHYPHGERKRDGIKDLTRNMSIDYSIFGYEDSLKNEAA